MKLYDAKGRVYQADKSKQPIMANHRGKVWAHDTKSVDGEDVEFYYEATKGLWYYFELAGQWYEMRQQSVASWKHQWDASDVVYLFTTESVVLPLVPRSGEPAPAGGAYAQHIKQPDVPFCLVPRLTPEAPVRGLLVAAPFEDALTPRQLAAGLGNAPAKEEDDYLKGASPCPDCTGRLDAHQMSCKRVAVKLVTGELPTATCPECPHAIELHTEEGCQGHNHDERRKGNTGCPCAGRPNTFLAEEETAAPKEYQVKEAYLSSIEFRFQQLARRARRLGVDAPTYGIVRTEDRPVMVKGVPHEVLRERHVWIVLEGEAPQVKGYTFVGKVEHGEEIGNIVKAAPGFELPVEFRQAEPICHHCNTRRIRKDTFVLLKDGVYVQVGRNCLADFLGGHSAEGYAATLELLSTGRLILEHAAGDDEGWFGEGGIRGEERYSILSVLVTTASYARKNGWLSATKAKEEGGQASAYTLRSYFQLGSDYFRGMKPAERAKEEAKFEADDSDAAVAREALDWASELGEDGIELSDYFHNIKLMSQVGTITGKNFGLACSIVATYMKVVEGRVLRSKRAEEWSAIVEQSRYQGEVGKRGVFKDVTVTRLTPLEGDYGLTTVHGFLDANNNLMVWFKSGEADVEVGKSYRLKGTVKEHQDYNGAQQTVLTRVEIIGEEDGHLDELLDDRAARDKALAKAVKPLTAARKAAEKRYFYKEDKPEDMEWGDWSVEQERRRTEYYKTRRAEDEFVRQFVNSWPGVSNPQREQVAA